MEQQHLIHRQSWHITATTSNALALQAKVAELVQRGELQQRLSDAFDAMVSPEEWLVLDRLDVTLNDLPEEELESQLVEQVVRQVRQQLGDQKAKLLSGNRSGESNISNLSEEQRTLQAFCYFLRYGVLPWWYKVTSPAAFEAAILKSLEWFGNSAAPAVAGAAQAQLKRLLASATTATRFLNQFSENIFAAVVSLLLSGAGAAARAVVLAAYQEFAAMVQAQHQQVYQLKLFESKRLFLAAIAADAPAADSWLVATIEQLKAEKDTVLLPAILRSKRLLGYVKEQQQEQVPRRTNFIGRIAEEQAASSIARAEDTDKRARTAEGVVIKNAGLILAAPFLPGLFSACNLVTENKLIYVDKAIALLHYLVFGHTDYREYDTLLNKVLCGVPEAENITLLTELSAAEKEQVEALLRSMISHWGALKNTSPDGLREGFLQRRGKLVRREATWHLQVEQNTLDILLQQLPWTISYIKLPWMKELLRTEWG